MDNAGTISDTNYQALTGQTLGIWCQRNLNQRTESNAPDILADMSRDM